MYEASGYGDNNSLASMELQIGLIAYVGSGLISFMHEMVFVISKK